MHSCPLFHLNWEELVKFPVQGTGSPNHRALELFPSPTVHHYIPKVYWNFLLPMHHAYLATKIPSDTDRQNTV
jgi:hypothetical protein